MCFLELEMDNLNFVAIDFETATYHQASICEAGISVVINGKVDETRSWLVRPEGNLYNYWNINIHGIHPEETVDAPSFPDVWKEIEPYLDSKILVAHNAGFDMSCLRHSFDLYGIEKPRLSFYCTFRAARHLYDLSCYKLAYLCDYFDISYERHHRAGDDAEMCANLFLREIKDAGISKLPEMKYCRGKL
jgi:DNA polymerase-3 subunit epsilon